MFTLFTVFTASAKKTHTTRPDAARFSSTLPSLNLSAAKRTRVLKQHKMFDLFRRAKRLVDSIIFCFNYILKQQDAAKLQLCPSSLLSNLTHKGCISGCERNRLRFCRVRDDRRASSSCAATRETNVTHLNTLRCHTDGRRAAP